MSDVIFLALGCGAFIAFAAYAGDTALQRLEIISGIHEELDDTE